MAKASYLGLGSTIPGPYISPEGLYSNGRFKEREAFIEPHSGTRAGGWMGHRTTVYANTPGRVSHNNFTNMAEQVEKDMGNCKPCLQDLAPAYGPPAPPNVYTSYPVLSPFENRRKWDDNVVRAPAGRPPGQVQGNGAQGNGGRSPPSSSPPPGFVPTADHQTPGGELLSHHPVPTKHQPIFLGCNLMSNGEDQWSHRMTYLNRWFDEDNGEIMVSTPPSMKTKYTGGYTDELFKTPIDNTENKISTGVMINPYTGEMYETFENAMPPPNTDKWIPSERFEIVNPKLLQMFGGLDPHAPLPKKKEVCLSVPTSDFGPNVWGDQLYEEERRRRMVEVVNRELWNNRDGDYASPLAFAKEKPAGFVGVQPMYRALPYLPPTQTLDLKGYVPVTSYQAPESTVIKAEVEVRKPDLTTCVYVQPAGPLNDQPAEYVVTQYTNRPTWRGGGDTYYAGVPYLANNNTAGPQQIQNKSTLKEQMEQTFPALAQANQVLLSGGNEYVVNQFTNKSTLKEQMESEFPALAQANQVLLSGGNEYVVNQYTNKSTLKEQMESEFPVTAQTNEVLLTGGNEYVVNQFTNKSTLKEQMETEFPALAQDNQVLLSGGNEYVVNQYENRSTLKQLMQQSFGFGSVSDGGDNVTGEYVPFQGPLLEVARSYYEYLPEVGRPASFSDGVGGDYVGNGLITSRQNRGTDSLDWVTLSKVPQDAEDSSVTWIGVYDRDTKREFGPYTPLSDLAPSYQAVANRMFGALTPQCNLDLRERDDEFLWSSGFAPQIEDVITG